MKRSFLAICSCLLLFAGCKEHDPALTLSAPFTDTTYMLSSVPTTDVHQVLVEEFTGQGCPNCPTAHTDLDEQVAANPGRINVISYYFYGGPQTVPDRGSVHDLRDSIATNISNSIYGDVGALPSAGIDRLLPTGSTSILLFESSWNSYIANQQAASDSFNLLVTSSYNTVDSVTTATIVVTVTYTQAVSSSQSLSIALVEDSIVDLQEDNAAASGLDTFYLFTSVFRDMITSIAGQSILPTYSIKEPGRVEQFTYNYSLPKDSPAIIPAHCRIIAFVTESDNNRPILQSAQCKLGP